MRNTTNTASLTGALTLTSGWRTVCVTLSTMQVQCWGSGANGSLGDGSSTNAGVPRTMVDTDSVSAVDEVLQVAAQGYTTCVLRRGNDVRCTGYNTYSQAAGDGTTAHRFVPASLGGLPTVTRNGGPI